MSFSKKIFILFPSLMVIILLIYFISKSVYHHYTDSTQDIKFIETDTTAIKNFDDMLKDSLFKGKITYMVLEFEPSNNDLREDHPFLRKLYYKYHNEPFQIVYLYKAYYDFFAELRYKLGVRKHNLVGNHLYVHFYYQFIDKSGAYPRYVLVKDGIIADSVAARPARFKKLCKSIDSLSRESPSPASLLKNKK